MVGTATARELISISGFTVMTSGPWWLGTFSTGLIALMGPFFESPGSAALRIMVHSTLREPPSSYSGTRVRESPVVLQETTLVPLALRFAAWLALELYDRSVSSCLSPPWNMCLIPAASYLVRFAAPILPGAQSTTTSTEASRSESPPRQSYPPDENEAMRSGSSVVQYSG